MSTSLIEIVSNKIIFYKSYIFSIYQVLICRKAQPTKQLTYQPNSREPISQQKKIKVKIKLIQN